MTCMAFQVGSAALLSCPDPQLSPVALTGGFDIAEAVEPAYWVLRDRHTSFLAYSQMHLPPPMQGGALK